jgi:hypothetical protein
LLLLVHLIENLRISWILSHLWIILHLLKIISYRQVSVGSVVSLIVLLRWSWSSWWSKLILIIRRRLLIILLILNISILILYQRISTNTLQILLIGIRLSLGSSHHLWLILVLVCSLLRWHHRHNFIQLLIIFNLVLLLSWLAVFYHWVNVELYLLG